MSGFCKSGHILCCKINFCMLKLYEKFLLNDFSLQVIRLMKIAAHVIFFICNLILVKLVSSSHVTKIFYIQLIPIQK